MAAYSPTSSEIDPAEVLRQAGWPPPTSCSVVQGGWDTYIWRFRSPDGAEHALRVYRQPGPNEQAREIGESARREEASLRALGAAGLPTPAVEASGTYHDLPFFILSWLRGRALLDLMQTKIWRLRDYGRQFGRLQARMHAIPPPPELTYASDDEWIMMVGDPALEEAVRRVASADVFCHFDFHPVNVLSDGRTLTGLIDFSFSGVADRRADLGRTLAILSAAPIPPSPMRPVLEFFRGQFVASWRRGYTEEAGEMPLTPLFETWGAATFLRNIEEAVADGRGWGRPGDIETMRRHFAERRRAAGVEG